MGAKEGEGEGAVHSEEVGDVRSKCEVESSGQARSEVVVKVSHHKLAKGPLLDVADVALGPLPAKAAA